MTSFKTVAAFLFCASLLSLSAQSIKSVKFFEHTNYQGGSMNYTQSQPDLTRLRSRSGNWNDQISSIAIPEGWTVTVYEHTNYQGRSLTLRGNQPNLLNARGGPNRGNWNDAISSFRIQAGNNSQQSMPPGWKAVGYPSAASGVWVGDRGGRVTLSQQSIDNGSNQYRIEKVINSNGVYKFICNWSGYYYAWFMRFGRDNDTFWYYNPQYFTSATAAYGAPNGDMQRYTRANQSPAMGRSPVAGSSPAVSANWQPSSLPANLVGRFRKSGNSPFTISNQYITQGSSSYKVVKILRQGNVYKAITTSNGYHVVMFLEYQNPQFIRFAYVNKAFRSYAEADREAMPDMRGQFTRAMKQ
ncbi:MAG: peptidase inhibitor family I36 protein [Calditrichaeota bacterium]|nr:peptidase inhibitor family I36 protein [Calditrichota bacterium]